MTDNPGDLRAADPVEYTVAKLFAQVLTDWEFETLTRLVDKAGLRWDCPACGYTNPVSRDACDQCMTPRPGVPR